MVCSEMKGSHTYLNDINRTITKPRNTCRMSFTVSASVWRNKAHGSGNKPNCLTFVSSPSLRTMDGNVRKSVRIERPRVFNELSGPLLEEFCAHPFSFPH